MFALYAIVLVVPLFLFWLHQKQKDEDAKVGVPGPKGWPLLGAVFETMPYVKTKKMFQIFHDYHERYGDTYQMRIGPVKMIMSRDPKITEAVVTNPKFGKGREVEMLKPILGDSLIMTEGQKWHNMRKLLTPAFHFQILERFVPIFEEHVATMIENIKKDIVNPKSNDVIPMFYKLALGIISETSMGVTLNAELDEHSQFIEVGQKLLTVIEERFYSGYLSIDWIFRLSSLYKIQTDCVAYSNNFVDKVIKQRRDKLSKEIVNPSTETDSTKRPALLDILLQAQLDGEPLSNEEILDEVKTFMFAGLETTATSLSWTSYLIAKHPDVQEKMWLEIKSNSLGVTSDHLTIRKLNSLSYMDNVIKESLRLYPPGVLNLKRCREDIQVGHVFIPANTTIATNVYSSHRNEKYFKNAEKFDPDRFANEISAEDRNPFVYQPFSCGLRNCIGQRFAMLEMKTVLVKLLSAFELTFVDKDFEADVITVVTLKSGNGVQLKFKERSK